MIYDDIVVQWHIGHNLCSWCPAHTETAMIIYMKMKNILDCQQATMCLIENLYIFTKLRPIKCITRWQGNALQWFNTMDRRNGNCPFHRCFPVLNLTILTLNTTDGDIKHKTQSRESHRWLEGDHCAGVKIRIWKTGAMMQSLERSLGKLVNSTYKPSE